MDKFEINSSKESDITTKLMKLRKGILYSDRFRLVDSFHLELSKINKPAWIHITYWFYNDEFFEGDIEGAMTLKGKFLPHCRFVRTQSRKDLNFEEPSSNLWMGEVRCFNR